jgi:uncharacterized membrane protein SirB2
MDYATLKLVHQTAVTLSMAGFFARGAASLADATWVQSRPAKTLPHIVDTVLLASAIALAWMLNLNPMQTPWLLAKIVGLLVYIGVGIIALRPSLPRRTRAVAWVGALMTVAWIVSVAITKRPAGFFTALA